MHSHLVAFLILGFRLIVCSSVGSSSGRVTLDRLSCGKSTAQQPGRSLTAFSAARALLHFVVEAFLLGAGD